jgi:hypothetical protein
MPATAFLSEQTRKQKQGRAPTGRLRAEGGAIGGKDDGLA